MNSNIPLKMQIIADKKAELIVLVKNNRLSRWKQLFVSNSLHQFSAQSLFLLVLVLTCDKTNKNTNMAVWGNVTGNHRHRSSRGSFLPLQSKTIISIISIQWKLGVKTLLHSHNLFLSFMILHTTFHKNHKTNFLLIIEKEWKIHFLIYSMSFIKDIWVFWQFAWSEI